MGNFIDVSLLDIKNGLNINADFMPVVTFKILPLLVKDILSHHIGFVYRKEGKGTNRLLRMPRIRSPFCTIVRNWKFYLKTQSYNYRISYFFSSLFK